MSGNTGEVREDAEYRVSDGRRRDGRIIVPPHLARASAGSFEGVPHGSGVAWLGIRYAKAERFSLAEPAPVAVGSQVCDRVGNPAPQTYRGQDGGKGYGSASEDCLFLNIYSPAADGRRRPVMVWIHGGGFVLGTGALYDGGDLAARGIVVVTINYRLGMFGFSDLSDLGVPTNLGLRDQIAALQWVRENIGAFGGDLDQVTLAGESAGSFSVSLLTLAPAAQGLFHRAILQSGALSLIHERGMAQRLGARHRALLGDDGRSLAALRSAPVARILQAHDALAREINGTLPTVPVWDGDLLPGSLEAARSTASFPMPMIIGWMRDEIRMFEMKATRGMMIHARPKVRDWIERQLGAAARDRIDAAYPDDKAGSRALATDANFAQPMLHFAERHAAAGNPTWVYRFDREAPFVGATHGLELAYLWPLPGLIFMVARGGPLIGGRRRLADRMRNHWTGFVRNGDPGADWPSYQPKKDRAVRLYDRKDLIVHDPQPERREAWAGLDLGSGADC